jgi:hypothetical protein
MQGNTIAFTLGPKTQNLINNLRREIFRQMLEKEDLKQKEHYYRKCTQNLTKELSSAKFQIQKYCEEFKKERGLLTQTNEKLEERIRNLQEKIIRLEKSKKKELYFQRVKLNKEKVEWVLCQFYRYEKLYKKVLKFGQNIKKIKKDIRIVVKKFKNKLFETKNEKQFLQKYINILDEKKNLYDNTENLNLSNYLSNFPSQNKMISKQSNENENDFGKISHKVKNKEIPWVFKRGYKNIDFDEILDNTKDNEKSDSFGYQMKNIIDKHKDNSININEFRGGSLIEMEKRWSDIQSKISQYIN